MTAEQITAEALSLPTEARRRLDEILQGKVETIPGDEALARGRRVAAE